MNRYATYTPQDAPPLQDGDDGWTGVNSRLDPKLLPKGLCAGATNTRFRTGKPRSRPGCIKLSWTNPPRLPDPQTGQPDFRIAPYGTVYGRGEFNDPDGNYWQIIAADGNVYAIAQGNPALVIPLPPRTTVTGPVTFTQAFNTLLMWRGTSLYPLACGDIGEGFQNVTGGYGNFLYRNAYAQNASAIFPPNLGINYDNGQLYGAGDLVLFTDNNYYRCTGNTTAGQSPASHPATWSTLMYDATASYTLGQLTYCQGTLFSANGAVAAGPALDPASNPGAWTIVTSTLYQTLAITTAGQTPVSAPSVWGYFRTLIPPADSALYYQNSVWAVIGAQDLVEVSDALSYATYVPSVNLLRINQGTADHLLRLVKYNDTTIIACKTNSLYIIGNVTGVANLASLTLDTLTTEYGLVGYDGITVAGADLWLLTQRGVASFIQTELNLLHGDDEPKSKDIQKEIDRINWPLAAGAQAAWWDNKFYCAVPLDDGEQFSGVFQPLTGGYQFRIRIGYVCQVPVTPGLTYAVTFGASETSVACGQPDGSAVAGTALQAGYAGQTVRITAATNLLNLYPVAAADPSLLAVTAGAQRVYEGVNNAVLVYDFLTKEWSGYDTGPGVMVKYFLKGLYNQQTRLFFVSADGYLNLYEEGTYDQVGIPTQDPTTLALGATPVETTLLTRSYLGATSDPKKLNRVTLRIKTWWPEFTLQPVYAGAQAKR